MTARGVTSRLSRSLIRTSRLSLNSFGPGTLLCQSSFQLPLKGQDGLQERGNARREMSSKAKLESVLGKFTSVQLISSRLRRNTGLKEAVNPHKAPSASLGDYEHHDPPDLTFGEFEEIRKAGKAVLVDVRNPDELESKGIIPGGVNVPTPEFAMAFTALSPTEFEEQYGFARPGTTDELVVYCQIGKRSMEAARYLARHGYTDVKNYSGLDDWTAKTGRKDNN